VSDEPGALRYVALGDSYTIGTAVRSPEERFPNQLVAALSTPPSLELVANLGVNGYTSADLIRDELPELDRLAPEFVTIAIGTNDVVQDVPSDRFEANLATILDELRSRLPADRIVAVGMPDYTVTPSGGDYGDPRLRADAIAANDASMARLAGERGIAFVPVLDLSLRALVDPGLVAADGLHPSGAQYALWVERILPVVVELLAR
jgi:acyl-CoA thioesterase I